MGLLSHAAIQSWPPSRRCFPWQWNSHDFSFQSSSYLGCGFLFGDLVILLLHARLPEPECWNIPWSRAGKCSLALFCVFPGAVLNEVAVELWVRTNSQTYWFVSWKNHSFMVLWCQCPNPEQTKGDGPKNTFSSRRVVLGLFLCCFLQWAFCWPLFAVLLSAEDWQIPPLLWTSQCESGFKINVLKKCQAGLGADIAWVWISLFTTRAGSVHALLSVCPPPPFRVKYNL